MHNEKVVLLIFGLIPGHFDGLHLLKWFRPKGVLPAHTLKKRI